MVLLSGRVVLWEGGVNCRSSSRVGALWSHIVLPLSFSTQLRDCALFPYFQGSGLSSLISVPPQKMHGGQKLCLLRSFMLQMEFDPSTLGFLSCPVIAFVYCFREKNHCTQLLLLSARSYRLRLPAPLNTSSIVHILSRLLHKLC